MKPTTANGRRLRTTTKPAVPLTLVSYGLLGDSVGLHNIWHMSNTTEMAALSLGVVAAFAALLTAVSIRVFNRSAVR